MKNGTPLHLPLPKAEGGVPPPPVNASLCNAWFCQKLLATSNNHCLRYLISFIFSVELLYTYIFFYYLIMHWKLDSHTVIFTKNNMKSRLKLLKSNKICPLKTTIFDQTKFLCIYVLRKCRNIQMGRATKT